VRRWRTLAVALAVGLAPAAVAQPARSPFTPADDAPNYRYAVAPQAGEWLICVQTFKGEMAQQLAEEMAEIIRQDYKLPAYLYDRGRKQRAAEEQRIREVRQKYDETLNQLKAQGIEPIGQSFRVRTFRAIEDEFAVLIGKPNRNLKDIEAARDFLDDVRKLKPPPERYSNKAFIGIEDPEGKKVRQVGTASVNPFVMAMVAHNPSISMERKQDDPEKADDFLKELNASEKLSVLRCKKPWTLVVKVFQGPAMLAPKSPSLMAKIGLGKKEPEYLNAGAQNAHVIAEALREMKPSFEAYVMHHRSYSIVTVGQYNSYDDPELVSAQKTLANLQMKDQKSGVALVTLSAQPLPMKIPR
jgi:hypothetical protein